MNRTLDARPDEADFRDFKYEPGLINVYPEIPIRSWERRGIEVLDQGSEGACTGFALATVAHYLLRTRAGTLPDDTPISARAFYENAKDFDAWPGDEYDWSSCRGAVKGWYHRGACSRRVWPNNAKGESMTPARAADAARRPLGSYYRVNSKNLNHMFAALSEVGVLYASAWLHPGWNDPGAIIEDDSMHERSGGHAFAIVGYDADGLWIQNSWGKDWGRGGCAQIGYSDWLANGKDVWALRLGVTVNV